MPSYIDELLNNISLLEERIAELSRAVICWQDKYDALQEELNLYRRQRFGRSAEPHPPQGEVFNEAEVEAESPVNGDAACEPQTSDSDVATLADEGAENSEPGKAKKRRPPLPPILPRNVITISLPPEEQICDCCNQPMPVMGEEIREELELIPAHVQVTRYVREKYSCRCCEQHGTTGSVKVASVVPGLNSQKLRHAVTGCANHRQQVPVCSAAVSSGGFVRGPRHSVESTNAKPMVIECRRPSEASAGPDAQSIAGAAADIRR